MEFILGLLVGGVIAYYWVNGSHKAELAQLRHSAKQLGEELAGWRQKYYTLQQQLSETKRQLEVMSGDFEARQQRLLGSIGTAASNIDQILSLLPQVEDVRSYLNRLDPADVGKLDLPFAHEFQRHMTQSYADNLEAMGNLFHGLLKLSLGLRYLKATGATMNPGLRFSGDVFEELKGTLIEYAHRLDMPGFRERFARMLAISLERMERAYLNGDEQPDPQLVTDIIRAFDEAAEMLPEQRRSSLPKVVIVPEADEEESGRSNGRSPKADQGEIEDGRI
jgi:hypothetical protein